MSHETKELLRSQIDKIILVFLVVYFTLFMMILLIRFPQLDAGTLQWIEKSIDMAEGAIIGAVTTAAVMRNSPPPGSLTLTTKTETVATPPEKP